MAEPIYQHLLDGQEVEQEDINLLGRTGGLADDRVLAELLRLAPYDGANVVKAILPFAHQSSSWGTVVPNGATATARVLPFRAIVGARTAVTMNPLEAWRDIRSAVFAATTGGGALGAAVAFAPNTAGAPRWDLVYAAFAPDSNGGSRTRYVRDPATGAVSSPTVVTTLVQQLTIRVAQGTPSATPAPPPPPADGGGTFYIPLAYVRIDASFSATSTILPQDILCIAPIVSLSRVAGSFAVQPANHQFAPGGTALTAARLGTWGAAANQRPPFYLPPEMVGGESRVIAIDFSVPQNQSHAGVLAVVDDSRDWRNRIFRWTCFVRGAPNGTVAGFAWQVPTPAQNIVPSARAGGVGQDMQFGFGQSFVSDVNDPPFNGGMAMLVGPPALNTALPVAQMTETVGLMVDHRRWQVEALHARERRPSLRPSCVARRHRPLHELGVSRPLHGEILMSDNSQSAEWYGFALDALVITAMTVLTALRVAEITIFLAVAGPIVGARLAGLRYLRGGGGPPDHGAGGSAAVALVFALAMLFRRPAVA